MSEFTYDFADFYGNNNSPKTQQLVSRYPSSRRRSKAEGVKLPDLEEYKPSLTMDDIPKLRNAEEEIPVRKVDKESKSRAIATGVAALLGILSGGNVAQSAVAGYTGMQRGQDRLFAAEQDAFKNKQKLAMDQFGADSKTFGNRLALEKLVQSGVQSRNQDATSLAGLQMRQAGLEDTAGYQGDRLDLDYEKMRQAASKPGADKKDPYLSTLLRLVENPRVANKNQVWESIRQSAKAKDGIDLPSIDFMSMSPAEAARLKAKLRELDQTDQRIGQAGRRLNLAEKRHNFTVSKFHQEQPKRAAEYGILLERLRLLKGTDTVKPMDVDRIEEDFFEGSDDYDRGARYLDQAASGKDSNGATLDAELIPVYRNLGKRLQLSGKSKMEAAKRRGGELMKKSPSARRSLEGTLDPQPMDIPGVGRVKVTPRK